MLMLFTADTLPRQLNHRPIYLFYRDRTCTGTAVVEVVATPWAPKDTADRPERGARVDARGGRGARVDIR